LVVLMALWLCLAAVGNLFARQATALAPDAIFYNGKVITVDSEFSIDQAFAVKGDRFLAVGSNKEVQALAGPKTRLVNLKGHAVIPGLIDDHNHESRAANLLLRGVDMTGVHSVAEILGRIRQAAAIAKPGQTVFTNVAWNSQDFPEKRGPTRQELDEVSGGHPVVVQTSRGRAYLNTAALKFLGIGRDTKSFDGWPVPKDSSGEPTGLLRAPVGPTAPQTLQTALTRLIPQPTDEEEKQLIIRMQERQNALGITGIREPSLVPKVMRVYQELWQENKLTIRVSMALKAYGSTDPNQLEAALRSWGVSSGFGDHWLRLGCVGELQTDGIVVNAYLRKPFMNPPGNYYGSLYRTATPENIRRLMAIVDRYGWCASTHVWGDKGLDVVLDAYEAANRKDGSIKQRHWIVEHALLIHPDQMERMVRLGVMVSAQAQPYFMAKTIIRAWGEERANKAEPVRELLDHHLIVGSGSDWPSLPNNPFVNFYFYVTRKTEDGTV
ncbi:MAG: amidohydrolase, partial [Ktedonobacteraceae bacterium]